MENDRTGTGWWMKTFMLETQSSSVGSTSQLFCCIDWTCDVEKKTSTNIIQMLREFLPLCFSDFDMFTGFSEKLNLYKYTKQNGRLHCSQVKYPHFTKIFEGEWDVMNVLCLCVLYLWAQKNLRQAADRFLLQTEADGFSSRCPSLSPPAATQQSLHTLAVTHTVCFIRACVCMSVSVCLDQGDSHKIALKLKLKYCCKQKLSKNDTF